MADPIRDYKIRYSVELWGKPRPHIPDNRRMGPRVVVSQDDHGYTDTILVVSILRYENGDIDSIALFDSDSGCGQPSRELLEAVRDQINHHLERHCPE